MEGPHLCEAKLAMQGHRCVVRQDYARDGDVHCLIIEVSEQRSVQIGAYALAAASASVRFMIADSGLWTE